MTDSGPFFRPDEDPSARFPTAGRSPDPAAATSPARHEPLWADVTSDPDLAAVRNAVGPRWSMTELRTRVASIATGLRALGVQCDDVVTVVSAIRPEMLEAWLAIIELGATFNPVNSSSAAAEIAEAIARTRTTTVIVDARAATTLRASLETAPVTAKVVGFDVQADDDGPILGFDALRLEAVESHPQSLPEDP